MRRLGLALMLVAVGCADRDTRVGGPSEPDASGCPATVDVVSACVVSDESATAQKVALTGTVDEITRDDWACDGIGLRAYTSYPEAERYRVHVSDGTTGLWLGLRLPWSSPLVELDERISVDYQLAPRSRGGAIVGTLELRRSDGSLVLWVAADYGLARLVPPAELSVSEGDVTCLPAGDGPKLEQRALVVAAGASSATLAPGQWSEVGPYTAVHGGYSVLVHGAGCFDCTDYLAVAVVRGSVAALDARDRGR